MTTLSHTRIARLGLLSLAIALVSVIATPARADFTINFTQVGNDVVASGSGSFNFNEASARSGGSLSSRYVYPSRAIFISVPGTATFIDMDVSNNFSGPSNFGTGLSTTATSNSGNYIGLLAEDQVVRISLAYYQNPGGLMNTTTTWANTTLSALGLTAGTYVWSWGTSSPESFTINVDNSVPEPSTHLLFAIGAVTFVIVLHRRKPTCG